jgi:two-component system, OmpR family, sensor kinase
VWLAFLLASVLGAIVVVGYELQRVNQLRQVDADLELRLASLSGSVREFYRDGPPPSERESGRPPRPPGSEPFGPRGAGPFEPGRPHPPPGPPPRDRPPPPDDGSGAPFGREAARGVQLSPETLGLFGEGYYFTVWYRDGSVLQRSANAPLELPVPGRAERDTLPHFRTRGESREALHCSGLGECVLAGKPLTSDLAALRTFRWTLLGAGALIFALSLAIGWGITTRAIRPIEEISAAALRISTGDLSGRVRIHDPDTEFGRLASVLNTTFSRLEAAFARQVQFTDDAAHELRTPLAVLISETQTALSRKRTAVEYRETIVGCLETAQQMRQLTETLLTLARIDGAQESLERGPVDLSGVARLVADRLRRQADERGITIHCDLAPATAFSVRERVDQVMTNLLGNAIYYNHPGGEVRVSTRIEERSAVFVIADTGEGIGAAHLPRIFDRFYRADKVRSRSHGHAGLGLAICRSIVDAERGTISVESAEQKGTTFTVRLPLGPEPVEA